MAAKPLPRLKTSWLSESCKAGFWLLLALFWTVFSFAWHASKFWQWALLSGLLIYLGLLLWLKYRFARKLLLLLLLLFGFLCWRQNAKPVLTLPAVTAVKLYPDQIKLNKNWLFGIGHVRCDKVIVTGQLTDRQKQALRSGQSIALTDLEGQISSLPPASNLGEFDFKRYYAGQGIRQKIVFRRARMSYMRSTWLTAFHRWRYHLQLFCDHLPPYLSFFTSELLLAENNQTEQGEVRANYRDLGIIHLLSISGLHVSLYVLALTSLCCALRLTDREVFGCCLLALIVEIGLSGGQPGFIRASLTYLLAKVSSFKKWPLLAPDRLGLACCLHLLANPLLFWNIGAVLSYILALGLQITSHFSRLKQALCLNLLILPLLLNCFFQVNVLAVLFNLIFVPYFNYWVMPITFLNILLGWCCPEFTWMCEGVLSRSERLIAALAHAHIGLFTFGQISACQSCLLLLLTLFCLVLGTEETKRHLSKRILFLLAGSYCCLFLLVHFPLEGQVTFIDVGQGDSILITTPFKRKVYLIDTGGRLNFTGRPLRPQVERITLPLLRAQGITRIDGLFVSHQDADHVGDLRPLLAEMPVTNLYVAKGILANPSFCKRLKGVIAKRQVHELLAGDRVQDGQLCFDIVHPFHRGLGKNEDSLCLTFKLANKRWLFTGDLDQQGEKDLLTHYPDLRVSYFKLGHHGSRTASNPDFLKQIKPEMVFISAGRHNRFGHPHHETLRTLSKEGIPWASTQDCGMISWYYGPCRPAHFCSFLEGQQQ